MVDEGESKTQGDMLLGHICKEFEKLNNRQPTPDEIKEILIRLQEQQGDDWGGDSEDDEDFHLMMKKMTRRMKMRMMMKKKKMEMTRNRKM
eukprot:TRINITY_DN3704_c0_g1_i1.p1 TRINITY_DN3704_c0_g1~~TRINITY_DN3704_c0_g1_i1.p1  ORF type:complete len:91 (+),score=30.76 TRINITY_DN3704_c0_g1_i1:111-383(+)